MDLSPVPYKGAGPALIDLMGGQITSMFDILGSSISHIKSEFFRLNRFDSVEQLRKGLHDHIHYYNFHRLKPKLKGLSPVEYRTQALGL